MKCHEKLCWMKDIIISVVETELCNLEEVDTKELGEAIDMIKDLEEAIYYCTVTEAMTDSQHEKKWEMKKEGYHEDRMYYQPMMHPDKDRPDYGNDSYHDDHAYRDEREGRSYNSRRMYMEARDTHKDKAVQLRELERYMQELSQDITDMIADASPEEKQYLEKKITALASKIGQMK